MFTLGGRRHARFCDGVSRRDFLKIGTLGLGSLALPDILRAEAHAGTRSPHKAIIMVFLPGGPPHQDMVDLKPDAPAGIRGEFNPIHTNVPGIDICEHMPRIASMMDKFSILRTIVGANGEHAAVQCHTGYPELISKVQGDRPSLGAILSKMYGPTDPAIPPFVGLSPRMGHKPWANNGDPGYLGLAHAPYAPNGSELPSLESVGLNASRMGGRKGLLGKLDCLRRDVDTSGSMAGLDTFTRQAFDILTSSKLADALDVSKEDPRLRAKYGIGDMKNVDDGGPCCNDHFLMARRLVEAGARCVTIGFGRWDYHGNNFGQCRERLPKLDAALATLVEDLHLRGMDKDVTVITWGEFGRTPKINKDGGRDHWPAVSCGLIAGGGLKTGQVIGQTNKLGEVPKDRPVTFQNVFATLYHALGVSPSTALPDRSGRPMPILDRFEPIQELI